MLLIASQSDSGTGWGPIEPGVTTDAGHCGLLVPRDHQEEEEPPGHWEEREPLLEGTGRKPSRAGVTHLGSSGSCVAMETMDGWLMWASTEDSEG